MNMIRLVLLTLFGLLPGWAMATGCYVAQGGITTKETTLGNVTISVPPDMPVGTEIYRLRALSPTEAGSAGIICSVVARMYWYFDYGDIMYPESAVASPYGGRMFDTNVPGIGVVYLASGTISSGNYTKGYPYTHDPGGAYSDMYLKNNPVVKEFALIKTGDVQPGIMSGASLPTAVFSGGQSGDMHEFFRYRFNGQVTVTVPTCQIESPNNTVELGEHMIGGTFSHIGSATEWKDASIRLVNCPTFFGSRGKTAGLSYYGVADASANIWTLSLQPVNGVIDEQRGIISLDNSGSATAAGVGIQLSAAQSDASAIKLNEALRGNFPFDGSASLTIPIFARYIQTESSVTAGQADSSIIYHLEYK